MAAPPPGAYWGMDRIVLERLMRLRPEIEVTWKSLLRDEPALSPLGRTDTLGFLMDATLTQLFAGFEITPGEKWIQACFPIIASVHESCACGLGPLQRYFSAGEASLRVAAASLGAGAETGDLLERYRLLSQREIEAVCQACKRQDTPECHDFPGRNPVSS